MEVSAMRKILLAGMLGLLSATGAAQTQSPNEFMQEAAELFDQAIGDRRQELAENPEELYELIDEILLPRFDRRYAAQLVLGTHWRTASEEQRTAFIDAFYNSLMRQYADGVLQFDMSRIQFRPFRGDPDSARTVVRTVVTLDDGTQTPVDYGLVKRDSGWQVFDVIIEGISYIRNFRAEFNSEIRATSLDAVIARLQREAGQLAGRTIDADETSEDNDGEESGQ